MTMFNLETPNPNETVVGHEPPSWAGLARILETTAFAPNAYEPYPTPRYYASLTDARLATYQDIAFIDDLRRRNADSLGFLPGQALFDAVGTQRAWITLENKQPCGFLITSFIPFACHRPDRRVRVFYHCIEDVARRHGHGLRMTLVMLAMAYIHGYTVSTLRCRDDLPSNYFWPSCGFQPFGISPAGESNPNRRIIHYFCDLNAALASNFLAFRTAVILAYAARWDERNALAPVQWRRAFTAATLALHHPAWVSTDQNAALLEESPFISAILDSVGIARSQYCRVRDAVLNRAAQCTPIPQTTEEFHRLYAKCIGDFIHEENQNIRQGLARPSAFTPLAALAGTPPPVDA